LGAGAVGCCFGSRFALAGHDVTFIARGAQLRALQTQGLRIVHDGGTATQEPVKAVQDAAALGPVDAVLLCVKLYDTEAAARDGLALLGPETYIVTLQNGIDNVAIVERIAGIGRVIGAAVYVVASLLEPGVVERTGPWLRLDLAEPLGRRSARLEAFAAACTAAGIDAAVHDDLDSLLWSKFVLLSATSAMTALTRQTIGYLRTDPAALEMAHRCIQETCAVAQALGVRLPLRVESDALAQLCDEMPADAKASQLVDLERGRPLELESLSGAIHRLGRELGVPTPAHSTVYAALRPFVRGARQPPDANAAGSPLRRAQ
jgi:2-dehydropantoate 2-reductase